MCTHADSLCAHGLELGFLLSINATKYNTVLRHSLKARIPQASLSADGRLSIKGIRPARTDLHLGQGRTTLLHHLACRHPRIAGLHVWRLLHPWKGRSLVVDGPCASVISFQTCTGKVTSMEPFDSHGGREALAAVAFLAEFMDRVAA